jgi:hypothetical protein
MMWLVSGVDDNVPLAWNRSLGGALDHVLSEMLLLSMIIHKIVLPDTHFTTRTHTQE